MLQWLWNVLGVNQPNGHDKSVLTLPVVPLHPPASPTPVDPVLDTRQFTQIEVDNIKLEVEAKEAEAQLEQAMQAHMETINASDPSLKLLSQQLRDLEEDQAPATT